MWSCLAAHAAVLHLERQRIRLLQGNDDRLTRDIPSPLKVSNSRLNELKTSNRASRGYRLLTQSRDAGIDIFTKSLRSRFVFLQGHPECHVAKAGLSP